MTGRTLAFAAAVLALSTVAAAVRADDLEDKRQCAGSHEQTQRLRLSGKLRDARNAAIACAQETCPGVVRVECTRLLTELDAALPGVLLQVHEAGGERMLDVTVAIDGVIVAENLDGKPLAIEPGEHVVRVVARDGRTAQQRVVAFEGELRRTIAIELPAPVTEPAVALPPQPAAARDVELARSSVPWSVYTLGVAGLAGLGTFTFFGLRGYREQIALESACAPSCAPDRDDAMRRDYVVADVALAVGVVALAAAAWVYFAHDRRAPPTLSHGLR